MPTSAEIIQIARLFLFVREAGQNNGQRVNAIQYWSGGKDALGTSWCCWWATMVLDLAFQGASPIPRDGSCQSVYALAQVNGWTTLTPAAGDLFLYLNASGRAHHIGICTRVDGTAVYGIAANTSEDGKSNNGDRVAERPVAADMFIAYPRA